MFSFCKNSMENIFSGQFCFFPLLWEAGAQNKKVSRQQLRCAEAGNYPWDGLSFDCKCARQTYQWAMCPDEMLTVCLHRGSCDIMKEWKACWKAQSLWRIRLPYICVLDCSGAVETWHKHEKKSSWVLIVQYPRNWRNLSSDWVQSLLCIDKETETHRS